MKRIGLFSFLLITISCKQQMDPTTNVLQFYLDNYSLKIPSERHFYCLVPTIVCKGCLVEEMSAMDSIVAKSNSSEFTFITSNQALLKSYMLTTRNCHFLNDSLGKLDHLNLPIANLTVIETKDGHVIKMKTFMLNDSVPVGRFFREVGL